MFNKKIFLNKHIFFLIFINLIFFFITFNNPWTFDDYGYIHAAKLYNLINDQILTLEPFYFYSEYGFDGLNRYMPIYYLLNQLLPDTNILFHFVIVLFHTITSIIIFFIAKKIFTRLDLAFLLSAYYALNYSVSIKALSWNIFYGHVVAALFGFSAILILILYFEKAEKKIIFIACYNLLASLAFLTTESGLIFPILGYLIIIFFISKKNILKRSVVILFPLIIFISLLYFKTGKVLPLLEARINQQTQANYAKLLNPENKNKFYFYRSTYAPRNFETYIIRGFDNLITSFNISSIEKVIKHYDKKNYIKSHLYNHLYIYILLILFFSILLIIFLGKNKKNYNDLREFKTTLTLYLVVFLIYTIIFFRRDIGFGLSFCAGLLIVNLYKSLEKNKIKNFYNYFFIILCFPSILYGSTFFSYWGEDWGPRSKMIINAKEVKLQTKNQKIIYKHKDSIDYKNYYYYINFDYYKKHLKNLYSGKSFTEFQKMLAQDNAIFKGK
tara:strand:- start:519 stop:2015 length:1497 start_codon:yes stop_codon:yes gene_type:complete